MPRLGAFIAELLIPEVGAITFERTTNSHGQYTLWGDAEAMLPCVISVVPVSASLASERE
jgi:hypothetical protein